MPDCSYGEIQIGGKVPRKHLPALLAQLKKVGLLEAEATEEDLKPNKAGVLEFNDENAVGGAFYDLEMFLQKEKIDFDRQASSSYYYDPEDATCRSGVMQYCTLDAAIALRSSLKTLPKMSKEKLLAFVERHRMAPALKPFKIVDAR